MTTGEKLAALRKRKGITQERLSEILKVSRHYPAVVVIIAIQLFQLLCAQGASLGAADEISIVLVRKMFDVLCFQFPEIVIFIQLIAVSALAPEITVGIYKIVDSHDRDQGSQDETKKTDTPFFCRHIFLQSYTLDFTLSLLYLSGYCWGRHNQREGSCRFPYNIPGSYRSLFCAA